MTNSILSDGNGWMDNSGKIHGPQEPAPQPESIRELIARIIWKADPGDYSGLEWIDFRDGMIANGNEGLLYAQADAVITALANATEAEVEAAIGDLISANYNEGLCANGGNGLVTTDEDVEDGKEHRRQGEEAETRLKARIVARRVGAVECIDRESWDQEFRDLTSGIAVFAGMRDEGEVYEFSPVSDPIESIYALALPFLGSDGNAIATQEALDALLEPVLTEE